MSLTWENDMPDIHVPKVLIGYIPEPPVEKNRAVDHLLQQQAEQEVRRAVNRWFYSQDCPVFDTY